MSTKDETAIRIIAQLCVRFPKAFHPDKPRPLKLGLDHDLLALGEWPTKQLRNAIAAYAGRPRYLRSLTAGKARVGLDGKPAGVVTAQEEAYARAKLAKRSAMKADPKPPQRPQGRERRQAPERVTAKPLTPSPPNGPKKSKPSFAVVKKKRRLVPPSRQPSS